MSVRQSNLSSTWHHRLRCALHVIIRSKHCIRETSRDQLDTGQRRSLRLTELRSHTCHVYLSCLPLIVSCLPLIVFTKIIRTTVPLSMYFHMLLLPNTYMTGAKSLHNRIFYNQFLTAARKSSHGAFSQHSIVFEVSYGSQPPLCEKVKRYE